MDLFSNMREIFGRIVVPQLYASGSCGFTRALLTLRDNGGGVMIIPPGDYLDTLDLSMVQYEERISIFGFGRATRLMPLSGPAIATADNGHLSVSNLFCDGSLQNGGAAPGVLIRGAARGDFSFLDISGFPGDAIFCDGDLSTEIRFERIYAENCGGWLFNYIRDENTQDTGGVYLDRFHGMGGPRQGVGGIRIVGQGSGSRAPVFGQVNGVTIDGINGPGILLNGVASFQAIGGWVSVRNIGGGAVHLEDSVQTQWSHMQIGNGSDSLVNGGPRDFNIKGSCNVTMIGDIEFRCHPIGHCIYFEDFGPINTKVGSNIRTNGAALSNHPEMLTVD